MTPREFAITQVRDLLPEPPDDPSVWQATVDTMVSGNDQLLITPEDVWGAERPAGDQPPAINNGIELYGLIMGQLTSPVTINWDQGFMLLGRLGDNTVTVATDNSGPVPVLASLQLQPDADGSRYAALKSKQTDVVRLTPSSILLPGASADDGDEEISEEELSDETS